jgi:hypothetical protein
MRLIQNSNVAFRCPSDLKVRLEAYAEGNHLHVSSVIRSACSDYLKNAERVALAEQDEEFQARSRAYRRLCADKSFKSVGI